MTARKRLWMERLEDRCTPATFTVNSLDDLPDVNPGDGLAQDALGHTTLRAAIEEANASTGADVINFGNLPGFFAGVLPDPLVPPGPPVAGTITLSDALQTLAITSDVSIIGPGSLTV